MTTLTRSHAQERPATPANPSTLRSWLAATLLALMVAGAVMGFFLWIFPAKHYSVPIGWDQSEYLWRTKYAQVVGLAHIDQAPGSARSAKSGRPAFPVITATISSLGRVNPIRLAMVMPSVMAAVIGLTAGAFLVGVLRRPWWQLGVVALAVSLSPFVVRLMQPEAYMDNMFAAAVFLAAAIPLAVSLEDRRGLIPAALLLGAGATIHWAFFVFMAAVLLVCGAAYLPTSWKRWRSGSAGLLDTPTARIGESLLGGAAIGTGMIFAVLGNGLPKPRVDVSEFAKKLRQDLPKYKFAFTIPLAVLGGVALAFESRDPSRPRARTRFVLVLLASWCLVVLAGYLARSVLHLAIPAHRFLAFALAVPLLGVVALLWVAGLLQRFARGAITAVVIVVAVAVSARVAHSQWFQAKTWTDSAKIRDASTVAAYLDAAHVPKDRPVVFVTATFDWSTAALFGHMIRASMPGDRIGEVYVYVGSAEAYRAHRPVPTKLSERYWTRVQPILDRHPVAVVLDSFNDPSFASWTSAHPDSLISPTAAVVVGPSPPAASAVGPQAPVGPVSIVYLGVLAAFAFVLLVGTGLGWTVALFGRWLRPLELVAVSPAVAVAALVAGGILVDRVGVRLVGAGGAMAALLVAAAGWAVAWALLRRRSRIDRRALAT
jgi:hypothetical protein